ncbi:MAG: hypothetical protein LBB22_04440 [Treponema sp.]|nr:hypothetical protein [Treponema sp.]
MIDTFFFIPNTPSKREFRRTPGGKRRFAVVLDAFFASVYTGVRGVIAAVKSALAAAKRVPVVIKRGLMKPESVPVKANNDRCVLGGGYLHRHIAAFSSIPCAAKF